MTQQATFYVISENAPQATLEGLFNYTLFLAKHYAQQGARVYIQANDKQQAEALDEMLWQDAEEYPAHNLSGEGGAYPAPIEIGYVDVLPHRNRQLVINLANNSQIFVTNSAMKKAFSEKSVFAPNLAQVVDFVPCDPLTKERARERYKQYRQAGFDIDTLSLNGTLNQKD